MVIAVGSKNPTKLEAVQLAFSEIWPDKEWDVQGVEVGSGIADQPMSDEEAVQGATNRAQRAREAIRADYGVGLEGGLQEVAGQYYDCGWAVVVDAQGRTGSGTSIRMIIPPRVMQLIRDGKELGIATDIVFGKTNSKHAEGYFGAMTNNRITRARGYKDGVIAALVRFIQKDIFEE
jgi:inosine/xanthosine triphosphatase